MYLGCGQDKNLVCLSSSRVKLDVLANLSFNRIFRNFKANFDAHNTRCIRLFLNKIIICIIKVIQKVINVLNVPKILNNEIFNYRLCLAPSYSLRFQYFQNG